MLNMFRMLIHPSSGACDLFIELFHGLYYSGTMCVGVTLWFGWGGVVWCGNWMQAEALVLQPASSYFMGCIVLVRCVLVLRCNTNIHLTRAIQPMK